MHTEEVWDSCSSVLTYANPDTTLAHKAGNTALQTDCRKALAEVGLLKTQRALHSELQLLHKFPALFLSLCSGPALSRGLAFADTVRGK